MHEMKQNARRSTEKQKQEGKQVLNYRRYPQLKGIAAIPI